LDASRVVDVVSNLLNDAQRDDFVRANHALQEELREQHGARRERPLLSYADALANKLKVDWGREPLTPPVFTGRRALDVPLAELLPYIDWTFFFTAWELKGRFPAILDHPQYGAAARELYDNARALLARIVDEKLLTARGVYGFWPAVSDGDDLVLYESPDRRREVTRFNMLRQQEAVADGKPNLSLADFIMDRAAAEREPSRIDHVGAFAVTAGLGADDVVRGFERAHDDYNAILVKALADRLAEAFAAFLHARARDESGIRESLTGDEILAERHRGIRPGFGYPACPDHSEKFKLFDLLDAPGVGITLTEHAAMTPAASVSGLYFAHPKARYFTVGRLGEDQIVDYARRKRLPVEEVERWLTSQLAYEPSRDMLSDQGGPGIHTLAG
jgi:5-methyltetrahydrofolate--homocysteine methyltransferase